MKERRTWVAARVLARTAAVGGAMLMLGVLVPSTAHAHSMA